MQPHCDGVHLRVLEGLSWVDVPGAGVAVFELALRQARHLRGDERRRRIPVQVSSVVDRYVNTSKRVVRRRTRRAVEYLFSNCNPH